MRRLALALTLLALTGWRVAESCGPWYVLRASLNPVFWQPFAKSVPELLGQPRKGAREPVFAGMHAGGTPGLAAARRAYRELASWRHAHFQAWDQQEPPLLKDVVSNARKTVDVALAAHPPLAEVEELRLIKCKVSLREGESLLVVSSTKYVTAPTAPEDALRRARAEFATFISEAKTPTLLSEARGWLARCHYLLKEKHVAARLYLDELGRADSVLDRTTLLGSLRILFPYNGSAAGLADHLDEYFDTPRHALFVVNLVTNPVLDGDEDERRQMATIGRKALEALERHRDLFAQGEDSDALTIALMRASLYMGDPAAALRVADNVPDQSAARSHAEFRWMLGVAHFLLAQYGKAEPELLAVSSDRTAPRRAQDLAMLGLLAAYQKLDRRTDLLLTAFRYEDIQRRRGWDSPDDGAPWYVGPWPYVGWLMDLSYLLDVQLTEEELRGARPLVEKEAALKVSFEAGADGRIASPLFLVDYELAVRAARREDYAEARDIYTRLGAKQRAERMAELAKLHAAAAESGDAQPERRYAYAAFLADHPDQVFFNDLVWHQLQRYAFLSKRECGECSPDVLTAQERTELSTTERKVHDAQEERWRAFQILSEVASQGGRSALGRRATRKAIECLDRINTERFGREAEIEAARTRLIASLREHGPGH